MYLLEWGAWDMAIEKAEDRRDSEARMSSAARAVLRDSYESDFPERYWCTQASEQPRAPGPMYAFNDTVLELRCGGMEEKRGLITLVTAGVFGMLAFNWVRYMFGFASMLIDESGHLDFYMALFTLVLLSMGSFGFFFYFKYGFRISRLEMLTSRHLLIRFNRRTRQVHLHRPSYCGGIVTLPWETTGAAFADPLEDGLSLGMRSTLMWHPHSTGLPHMEVAMLGRQGQGGSELRDEWEFIRRFMEEGPEHLPRPRLSTHWPSPIQAFSAQFEGIGNFIRGSGPVMKLSLLLIWPAFLVIGLAHWLSLLLCWKPRWPKVIREAGLPGKPVPELTTVDDYAPDVRARLLANADRWPVQPGQRPEKKAPAPRRSRKKAAVTESR